MRSWTTHARLALMGALLAISSLALACVLSDYYAQSGIWTEGGAK